MVAMSHIDWEFTNTSKWQILDKRIGYTIKYLWSRSAIIKSLICVYFWTRAVYYGVRKGTSWKVCVITSICYWHRNWGVQSCDRVYSTQTQVCKEQDFLDFWFVIGLSFLIIIFEANNTIINSIENIHMESIKKYYFHELEYFCRMIFHKRSRNMIRNNQLTDQRVGTYRVPFFFISF